MVILLSECMPQILGKFSTNFIFSYSLLFVAVSCHVLSLWAASKEEDSEACAHALIFKGKDKIKCEREILFLLKPPIFFKIRLIPKHITAMICREACFIVLWNFSSWPSGYLKWVYLSRRNSWQVFLWWAICMLSFYNLSSVYSK